MTSAAATLRLAPSRWYGLARGVLVWWLAVVGVAAASPLLRPVGLEQVCSAQGPARWVGYQEGAWSRAADHLLDCSLCTGASVPPSEPRVLGGAALSWAGLLLRCGAAPWVRQATAALPARGPPARGLSCALLDGIPSGCRLMKLV